jgi:hypothetical protein
LKKAKYVSLETPPSQQESVAAFAHYLTPPPLTFTLSAPQIRGIYVSSQRAGSETDFEDLLTLCKKSGVNAMVIDVKTEDGLFMFEGFRAADELGISVPNIPDINKLLQKMADNHVYAIARVVTFKDNYAYHLKPELYIKNPDGSLWRDSQGSAWLNPYDESAGDYALMFAKAAASVGFREIQFDYVRFPAAANLEQEAELGDTGGRSRSEAILDFAAKSMEVLQPYGVKVSVDVYGTIINSDLDARIVGQEYAKLAKVVDVICPMVYPSHYANGTMGLDNPDLLPYDTIYKSMQISNERLAAIPPGEKLAVIRPWLQDFTAAWVTPHRQYGGKERGEQIQGAYDANVWEWLLWDSGVHYDVEGINGAPGAHLQSSAIADN